MALNSREKTLAWLVGGVAVVGIAYYAFTAFFWTPLQDIEKDIAGKQKILKDQQEYMDQHRAVAQDLAALQLKTDRRYPELLERLSQIATAQLGAGAKLEIDPPELGGVVARAGARSVDYTLPSLVDRAIGELDGKLETLWR